jgi:hypothetical protein
MLAILTSSWLPGLIAEEKAMRFPLKFARSDFVSFVAKGWPKNAARCVWLKAK